MRGFLIVLTLLFPLYFVPFGGASAESTAAPEFRSTGLSLPRFASLKPAKVHVRSGPGMQYPIEWVFVRAGLPVEILEEFEQWRKIRDHDGSEGWVNATMLTGQRRVLILGHGLADLRDKPEADSRIVAKAESGVVADLRRCREGMCQVATGGFSGRVPRNSIWGIYDHEELN